MYSHPGRVSNPLTGPLFTTTHIPAPEQRLPGSPFGHPPVTRRQLRKMKRRQQMPQSNPGWGRRGPTTYAISDYWGY